MIDTQENAKNNSTSGESSTQIEDGWKRALYSVQAVKQVKACPGSSAGVRGHTYTAAALRGK